MWPHDPDDFESLTQVPAGHSHDDAWYFVFIGQEILCVSEHGSPRPILADEMRWLDIERHTEIFLGRYQGRSCFAVAASRSRTAGVRAGGPALVGSDACAAPIFYLAGRAQQLIDWDRDHRFCGRCGTASEHHSCRPREAVPPVWARQLSTFVAEHHRARAQRRRDVVGAQRELAEGHVLDVGGLRRTWRVDRTDRASGGVGRGRIARRRTCAISAVNRGHFRIR